MEKRMKKGVCGIGLLVAYGLWLVPAGAAPPATAGKEPLPAAGNLESAEDQLLKQWRAKLEGTSWTLELRPLSGGGDATQHDTVMFQGGQVRSKVLSEAGYPSSNYTLTVQDADTATWETMQTKEGEGVVFWRGEMHGETLRGVLSKQPSEGKSLDYSFTGTRLAAGQEPQPTAPAQHAGSSASPSLTQAAQPAQEKTGAPPAQRPAASEPQQADKTSKKKHGWFR